MIASDLDIPFFSIIIPTYNSENHISKCLLSITAQEFPDYEIIIQDGLSKDKTLQVAEKFKSSGRGIKILSERDGGIYDAMNKAILKAKGNWILFLGSDDRLYNSQVLGSVHENIKNNDTVDFIYGNVKVSGNSHWVQDGEIYAGEFTVEKLFNQNISHQAIFYNRRVFETAGNFNTHYRVCADWDLNHRCFAWLKTRYIPAIISDFQLGGESTSVGHDDFLDWEGGINLKKYYGISYFNPLFKNFEPAFSNAANVYLTRNKYARSIFFFIVSFYHSQKRPKTFKNYCVNIFIYLKRKFNPQTVVF